MGEHLERCGQAPARARRGSGEERQAGLGFFGIPARLHLLPGRAVLLRRTRGSAHGGIFPHLQEVLREVPRTVGLPRGGRRDSLRGHSTARLFLQVARCAGQGPAARHHAGQGHVLRGNRVDVRCGPETRHPLPDIRRSRPGRGAQASGPEVQGRLGERRRPRHRLRREIRLRRSRAHRHRRHEHGRPTRGEGRRPRQAREGVRV